MKRIAFTLLLALVTAYAVNAQELTSKKGTPILPEKGDYALSIDAVPFFVYIGNMFHGTNQTAAPTFDFPGLGNVPMWTLQVKKFISPKMALRARIRLGFTSQTYKNTIYDQTDTTMKTFVDDKWRENKMNIVLGAGIERRLGKGRVQGLYGAMANLMIGTVGHSYIYGNNMTGTYTTPLSTEWNSDGSVYDVTNLSVRNTKNNDGMTFGFGVNGFAGVEYFFAPKMSIGGEFTWGMMFQVTGKNKIENEKMVGSDKVVTTTKRDGAFFFGMDNSNSGGAINLSFYF